jgi:hypothetical protein
MFTVFCWGNLRERGHLVEPDVDGSIILKWMDGREEHRFLVGKSEGKTPLESPRRRREVNIKIDGGQRCTQVSGG